MTTTIEEIEAQLLGPGSLFEVTEEEVLGERMEVFATRLPSLRSLFQNSADFGEAPYLVFGERRISYAENHGTVTALARGLALRHGIGKGDRVAILAANGPEWIQCFWAITSLGAICVGMNGWWVGDEIRFALDDCTPALLVADRKRLDRLEGADPGVPVLQIGPDFDALVADHAPAKICATEIDEDDPAVILYTSGTTGRPKGAVHSHRNVLSLISLQLFHGYRVYLQRAANLDPDAMAPPPDTPCQLCSSPLFHASGLYAGAVTNLAAGVKTVWTTGRFDPLQILETIERERCTGWSPFGPMAQRVLDHPRFEDFDLSSLTVIGTGGAPFPASLQAELRRRLPRLKPALAVGYGLTEATALATLEFGDGLEASPDSVGRPMPTVEVEVRDGDGHAVVDGTEGEICLRGPGIMLGYWGRPEETAAAIGPGRWLRTGDIGRMEGGRLTMGSRRTDLILRAAENVYPAEIENRLVAHPDVAEVAVVGIDDPDLGQAVQAIVVPRPGATLEPTELSAWVAERLAHYKVPAHWVIRSEALPRNATGKVLKALLTSGAPNPFVEE